MGDPKAASEATFSPVDYAAWRERVASELRGGSFDALRTKTPDGVAIEPLYVAADAPSADVAGLPGLPPFVRGARLLGSAERGWDVRQEHGHPELEHCNAAMRADLERGVTSLSVRLGLGRGTRVWTAGDVARLFDGIDLAKVPIWLDPGPDVLPMASALITIARERGLSPSALRGGFGADPLGTLVSGGTLPAGFAVAWREMIDLAAYTKREAPGMRVGLVSACPYHEAGATVVQEIAYAAATGLEYVRRLCDAGAEIDEAAEHLIFAFPIANDFFVEIAKLRAARRVWSKIATACGASADAARMRIHASTSRRTKTVRDPWVNMLRATAETLAAAIGGAEAISTIPFDAAAGVPRELGRRIARNTQLVLREEAHVHRVIDPAGGSHYVEALTESLARAAWAELQDVERAGGMVRAVFRGRIGRRIDEAAEARRRAIATREQPIVGVSEYAKLDEEPLEESIPDAASVLQGLGRQLGAIDPAKLNDAILELIQTHEDPNAEKGALVVAAAAAAAVGTDLRAVALATRHGRPSLHIEPLPMRRDASGWEALRDGSDAHFESKGARPRAFVASFGARGEHAARTDFVASVLAAAGIEPATRDAFDSIDDAVHAFAESGARVAVVSAPDARYPDLVPRLAPALENAGARFVFLAGKPGAHEADFRAAGVRDFLHRGADLLGMLAALHRDLGVKP